MSGIVSRIILSAKNIYFHLDKTKNKSTLKNNNERCQKKFKKI